MANLICSPSFTGVNYLLEYVTKGHEARRDDDALLGLALRSIYNILEHGLLPPSMLESHPHLTEKVRGGGAEGMAGQKRVRIGLNIYILCPARR